MLLVLSVHPIYNRFKVKSQMIMWRTVILQSVRLYHILQNPFAGQDDYLPLPLAWRTFRSLFRTYMRYVPIAKTISAELYKRRKKFRAAKTKLELIYSTMKACEYISECKSMQHSNPKGCSHCGVLYIGGTMSGDNRYVRSVSRDTGVPTLVTLEFEIETLLSEERLQLGVVRDLQAHLEVFEADVIATVVVNIQRWWGIVLAWKRLQQREQRLVRSRYWYRIRRLSVMKRDLDVQVLEAAPIDLAAMRDKYCDQVPQMVEYAEVVMERKRLRMLKWMDRFHRRLMRYVEAARYERYLRSLQVKPVEIVVRPIVFRTTQPYDKRQFVCFRLECHLRQFLTLERYDTHMTVHRLEDEARHAQHELNRLAKLSREGVEKDFLRRVTASRQYVAQTSTSALSDYSLDENMSRIVPPLPQMAVTTNAVSVQSSSKLSSLLTAGFDFSARIGNSSINSDDGRGGGSIPPLLLPTARDYHNNTVSPSVLPWVAMPHLHSLNGMQNSPLYMLEMVSKQGEVQVASRVRLDQPIVRIGTHGSCECVVRTTGAAQRETKISKIHCMLYCDMAARQGDGTVTLVDNSSLWGTYIVSAQGTRKVHTKIMAGHVLTPGLLICIGVCRDGPESLSATEANTACVVYRVRCAELEG